MASNKSEETSKPILANFDTYKTLVSTQLKELEELKAKLPNVNLNLVGNTVSLHSSIDKKDPMRSLLVQLEYKQFSTLTNKLNESINKLTLIDNGLNKMNDFSDAEKKAFIDQNKSKIIDTSGQFKSLTDAFHTLFQADNKPNPSKIVTDSLEFASGILRVIDTNNHIPVLISNILNLQKKHSEQLQSELQTNIGSLNDQLASAQKNRDTLEADLAKKTQALSASEQTASQLQSRIFELEKQIDLSNTTNKTLTTENSQLGESKNTLDRELNTTRVSLEEERQKAEQAKRDLDALRNQYDALNNLNNSLTENLSSANREIETLKKENLQLQDELRSQTKKLANTENRATELEKKATEQSTTIDSLTAAANKNNQLYNALAINNRQQVETIRSLEGQLAKVRSENKQQSDENSKLIEKLKGDIERERAQSHNTDVELSRAQGELSTQRSKITQLEMTLSRSQAELATTNKANGALTTQVEQLQSQLARTEKALSGSKQELANSDEANEALRQQISQLTTNEKTLRDQLTDTNGALLNANATIAMTTTELGKLQEMHSNLTQERNSLNETLVRAKQENRLLNSNNEELKNRLVIQGRALNIEKERTTKLNDQLATAQSDAKNAAAANETNIASLKEQLAKLTNELDTTKTALQEQETANKEGKEVNSTLTGIIQSLSKELDEVKKRLLDQTQAAATAAQQQVQQLQQKAQDASAQQQPAAAVVTAGAAQHTAGAVVSAGGPNKNTLKTDFVVYAALDQLASGVQYKDIQNRKVIQIDFTAKNLTDAQVSQMKQSSGLPLYSSSNQKFTFLLDPNDPTNENAKAVLTGSDATKNANESDDEHKQRTAITMIAMIDNVLAHSQDKTIVVTTIDPHLAAVATEYVGKLKSQRIDVNLNLIQPDGTPFIIPETQVPVVKEKASNILTALVEQLVPTTPSPPSTPLAPSTPATPVEPEPVSHNLIERQKFIAKEVQKVRLNTGSPSDKLPPINKPLENDIATSTWSKRS